MNHSWFLIEFTTFTVGLKMACIWVFFCKMIHPTIIHHHESLLLPILNYYCYLIVGLLINHYVQQLLTIINNH